MDPAFVAAKIEPVEMHAREREVAGREMPAKTPARTNTRFVHHVERLENITILKKGGGG